MLKLLVNNKTVTLPKNASIQLKVKNPAFNKEGAFSYPLKAPVEENRVTFGHADDESNLESQAPAFELYMGNELFMSGDIKLTETQGDFEFYLKAGKSAVANLLKSSYLDEEINGQSWGENHDGLDGLNASVNGKYPDYLMTVFPVFTDNFIVNDWNLDDQKLIEYISMTDEEDLYINTMISTGRINPVVFVKHVIKKLFSALELIINVNDLNLHTDFDRLCVFSHKKNFQTPDDLIPVANWLPHITAADLLNNMRERFNIVAFFNPFLNEVDYISFEKIFSADIVDWTDKYIRSETTPAKEDGAILLENEGDDDDVISYDELASNYTLVEMDNYAAMLADMESDYNSLIPYDKYYLLTDSNRVFKAVTSALEESLSGRYYIESKYGIGFNWFNLQLDEIDPTQYNFTEVLTADVPFHFLRWRFPGGLDGAVKESITIRNLGLYVVSGSNIDIEMQIKFYNIDSGEIITVRSKTINIDNSDPYDGIFFTASGVQILMGHSPALGIGWNYMWIDFYATCSQAGELGVKMGQQSPDIPFYCYAEVDGYERRATELGRIANYPKGDGDDPETSSPKNGNLLNVKERLSDFLFQMPASEMSPNRNQKNYAFTFYRGLIDSEVDGTQTAPFANFDDVDINMAEYYTRLTNGDDPDMTLRWQNDNGIVAKFWQKTINWILYYRRPVRKVFELSVNDLINFKMWHRVQVGNKLYVVNSIDVKANADGSLSNATVDMFTL